MKHCVCVGLGAAAQTLGSGRWGPDVAVRMRQFRCRSPDAGVRIRRPGCWGPDAAARIRQFGCRSPNAAARKRRSLQLVLFFAGGRRAPLRAMPLLASLLWSGSASRRAVAGCLKALAAPRPLAFRAPKGSRFLAPLPRPVCHASQNALPRAAGRTRL